ncbi:outer membrane protein assembly factor BamB [Breoghania corrubedonensis]|uniref:Outer membrane protein assembly factor BamB n=1 Tax=Breoghania corrubedonensis TaxID=665038 RepID=A0A2T5V9P5_9HYPH|nr:PQQ-binding-like beta-propeller repeat protein [Breoghania corrubedonensis]PTW60460.1 outer membrane protein assembly factor BamB [Breoghania corrubedonensis]
MISKRNPSNGARYGRRIRAVTTVLLAAVLLGGCSSISSLNPFAEKEDILPGDRQPLFKGANALENEGVERKTVSIPAPQNVGDWSQAGGNAMNNPGHVAMAGNGARAWKASLGGDSYKLSTFGSSAPRVSARPISYQGRIYIYEQNGTVTALSANGGRQWKVELRPEGESDSALGGGVAADSGRIFAATGYGSLVALNPANGARLWTVPLDAPARGAPTAAGGKVYVVTQTNEVVAINQEDGSQIWTYAGISETAGLLSSANPAISGNTVVVPFSSGEVTAIDAKDGTPKWSDAVSRSYRTQAISGLADVSASPVIAGGTVIATGVAGRTIGVSLKTGERLWEQDIGSVHTPAVAGNAVFLIDLNDRLVALDLKSGQPMWVTQLPVVRTKKKQSNWAGPVLAGNKLWMFSSDGHMALVNPTNGTIISNRETSEPTYMSPIVASGRMIVVEGKGDIVAYN